MDDIRCSEGQPLPAPVRRRTLHTVGLLVVILAATTVAAAACLTRPAAGTGTESSAGSPTNSVSAVTATNDSSAIAAGPTPATATQEFLLGGENGLWVTTLPDSMIVRWLSDVHASGFLSVEAASARRTYTTPAGTAHRATIAGIRGDSAVLVYGAGADTFRTSVMLAAPERPPVSLAEVDSLYVVGDTHGHFNELIAGLQAASLVDDHLRWSGGRSHLVFAGDLISRGPDVLRLLWFVYRLEREAARAGGRVHVLLGNHEIMVALGDLRYVHPRESYVATLHGAAYDRLFDTRTSVLGRWLASKPATIRVGRTLIAHGGVTPEYARFSIGALDDTLRTYVGEELFYRWADTTAIVPMDSAAYQRRMDFFWGPRSVFWHREYVQSDSVEADLTEVLTRWNADVLIVGHTPVPRIDTRYDGRLIAAHTPRHGAELLLLVRSASGVHERYRINAHIPPERF